MVRILFYAFSSSFIFHDLKSTAKYLKIALLIIPLYIMKIDYLFSVTKLPLHMLFHFKSSSSPTSLQYYLNITWYIHLCTSTSPINDKYFVKLYFILFFNHRYFVPSPVNYFHFCCYSLRFLLTLHLSVILLHEYLRLRLLFKISHFIFTYLVYLFINSL